MDDVAQSAGSRSPLGMSKPTGLSRSRLGRARCRFPGTQLAVREVLRLRLRLEADQPSLIVEGLEFYRARL